MERKSKNYVQTLVAALAYRFTKPYLFVESFLSQWKKNLILHWHSYETSPLLRRGEHKALKENLSVKRQQKSQTLLFFTIKLTWIKSVIVFYMCDTSTKQNERTGGGDCVRTVEVDLLDSSPSKKILLTTTFYDEL